ncbi:DUF1566 domain-containing protein [Variovorax paradoxus]|uniref:DUF1566 domain-containing protein n=1 Tax=Variovorax paradoxus TaxID=34073 RepID=UPI0004281AED
MTTQHIPAIGQPWPGQGGTYAGIMRGAPGLPDRHLIVPTAASAPLGRLAWGAYGENEPNAVSEWDGQANTRALLASKHAHPAAEACAGLKIDGHSDFYLPSRRELLLCCANVPELFDTAWYWSSTQHSRNGAFVQGFEHGNSFWNDEDLEHRVRACRGFTLEPLTTSAEGGEIKNSRISLELEPAEAVHLAELLRASIAKTPRRRA